MILSCVILKRWNLAILIGKVVSRLIWLIVFAADVIAERFVVICCHLFSCTWTWTKSYNLNHVVLLSCSLMMKLPHYCLIVKWAILSNYEMQMSHRRRKFMVFWGVWHLWQSVTECKDKHGANPVCFLCFSLITSVQPWVIFTLSSCRDGTLSQRASNPRVLVELE